MSDPIVSFEGVERRYPLAGGRFHLALRSLDLRITAGEQVAILGKSGSGKSTLLNLMAGLDRADGGRVRVAGSDLSALGEDAMSRWRGRQVGVVFQFFQLLPTLTAAENLHIAMDLVGVVPKSQRAARALALLDRVGVADQAGKLPAALSGGQQQRVAIARALANDPPLLLADEPTGNLDTETATAITGLFSSLSREGKTLVLVTHDDTLARASQRVIRLQYGAIVADGPGNNLT